MSKDASRTSQPESSTPSQESVHRHAHDAVVLPRSAFHTLLDALERRDYRILGPVLREGTITIDRITGENDLPIGWTDVHAPGCYRIEKRSDQRLFGYVVGQHSWKRFLNPPVTTLMRVRRENGRIAITSEPLPTEKYAFLGVRSCDVAGIRIMDRVMLEGPYADERYRARRKNALIIAVNCSEAKGCCFCVSMDTGPKAASGFDLALTEVLDGDEHYFVLEAGSDSGHEILAELSTRPVKEAERKAADAEVVRAAYQMGRALNTRGLAEKLAGSHEHPRWAQVAKRCLSCGNCTMVCPTCFCMTIEDHSDLTNENAERRRLWDSCFSQEFSYIHGGHVRDSVASRYRQWLMHKLSTWQDQFGSFGCVGCGRCIVWCPVGIDITEEAAAIVGGVDRPG